MGDFGLESLEAEELLFPPDGEETQVFKPLDDLSFSELRTVQFTFSDPDDLGNARFELNQFAMKERKEQTS